MDNIRSSYNVGSIFRTSDGFKIDELHLCGITPTPKNNKILKTSLGAEKSVHWTYYRNALDITKKKINSGYQIISLEIDNNSIPIHKLYKKTIGNKILLILGNETSGIDPDLRALSNMLIYIPMMGNKKSFNVTIAFGIAAFYFYFFPLKSTN